MSEQVAPATIWGGVSRIPPAVLVPEVIPGQGSRTAPPSEAPGEVRTSAPGSPDPGSLKVVPPADGGRLLVPVTPAMRVALKDPSFDPAVASYLVDGDDLVVALPDGGAVILDGFFSSAGAQPSLTILDGPEIDAAFLLHETAAATAIPQAEPQPQTERPEAEAPETHGGGAGFSGYDPGSVTEGVPATGLAAGDPRATGDQSREAGDSGTSLGDLLLGGLTTDEDAAAIPMPAGGTIAPQIRAPEAVEASFSDGVVVVGYQPPPTVSPGGGDVWASGLPVELVTLDDTREVRIVFEGEATALRNSVGTFIVGADGKLSNVRIAIADATAIDRTAPPDSPGIDVGATYSLGVMAKGATFGMFLVQDGFAANGGFVVDGVDLLKQSAEGSGRFSIEAGDTGVPIDLSTYAHDPANPPTLVFTGTDGARVVLDGALLFSTDPTVGTPGENPLNESGLEHVAHGYNKATGRIEVGFDDGSAAVEGERRFDNVQVGISYGNRLEPTLVIPMGEIVSAQISDVDGGMLSGAVVTIDEAHLKEGDILLVNGVAGQGFKDIHKTSITVELAGNELRFSGLDTIENYEKALSYIQFTNLSGESATGVRVIRLEVIDSDGNVSAPARTNFYVTDDRVNLDEVAGYDGAAGYQVETAKGAAVIGTSGKDRIFGGDGDDILIGSGGRDELFGGAGDDTLMGSGGRNLMTGGEGADTFLFQTLGGPGDEVTDFDIGEGDRLNVEDLLTDPHFDPTSEDASRWLRFDFKIDGSGNPYMAVVVDLDGSGRAYRPATIARLYNQDDPSALEGIDISSATTYERFFDVESEVEGEGEPLAVAAAEGASGEDPIGDASTPLGDLAESQLVAEQPPGSDGATV
jgi:RTX calcium-binding nonapeptide repeat (4 copies)